MPHDQDILGPFCEINLVAFGPSIARQRRLTISDIGVGETSNPQSLQGFLASFGASQPVRSTSGQSEKPKPMSAFHREKVLSVHHWT
ncbi:MAG: hypothetical protein WCA28_02175, partial [Bradyrhizobium sp.]